MKTYVYNSTVKRIIDGDTVVVDIDLGFGVMLSDQYIRLMGIDTPEIRTKDLVEKQKGYEAKEFVESKLSAGMKVIVESVEFRDGKDKYGRILGIIWYDGNNLNEELLKEGLAEVY